MWRIILPYVCCWCFVCIGCFCTSYIVSNHIFDTIHCRQIEGRCQLSPRYLSNFWVSWKPRRVFLWRFCTVLGVFVLLSSAHQRCWINYWAQDGMWWQMALCCSCSFLYIVWGLITPFLNSNFSFVNINRLTQPFKRSGLSENHTTWSERLLRDRPFNLKGGGGVMVFCFVQKFFFGQHKS
jgi:hypothetical protein